MSLEANFISENKDEPRFGREGANIIFPRQKLFFQFTDPPEKATDVRVRVLEDATLLDGTRVRGRHLGEMVGKIENKRFIPETASFRRPDNRRDPLSIAIDHEDRSFGAEIQVPLLEAEEVDTHSLRLSISGAVGGHPETFTSRATIDVHYPMAMIVPRVGAAHDRSLPVVHAWSKQWERHDPKVRKRVEVPFVRIARGAVDADYDAIVAAFRTAAIHAQEGAGVIALAVGHGDGGSTDTQPWFNLVPEDYPSDPHRYRLDIDDVALQFGLGGVNVPSDSDKAKLKALDRIAETLKAFPRVRRIILHSCKIATNPPFVQMVADRLQVPVRSHTESIDYTGAATARDIASHYGDESIVRPRDLRHWPVSRLASPAFPGSEPQRW